uniref:Aspartate--tRNA ligase n=1 Tax=uncultured marine thaumarchaeote AD1000_06_A03 TaxID=1455884 RepID=A0A075FH64_9ARCH|nr:aspartyl-tRNA synthetase (DARS, aspS) [uncultured marine thaumarchaeote AD1000_06_A03]
MVNIYLENLDEIDESFYGKNVNVSGWIEDSRSIGSLMFLTLRNTTGKLQLIIKKNLVPEELWNQVVHLTRQSVVDTNGTLAYNEKNNIVELIIKQLTILNSAEHPLPLDPTGRVDSGLDVILDARPLSLRKPEIQSIFKLRHNSLMYIREFFIKNNFIEVNTPKILSQGAEGGATLFKTHYFDKPGFLAQSPQLYKEQLMLAFERVYEISHYFRAEKSNTTRHLNEFVSIDFEWSYKNNSETMDLCEDLVKYLINNLIKNNSKELGLLNSDLNNHLDAFDRITYEDVINDLNSLDNKKNYGDDITEHDLVILSAKHKSFYFITDWPSNIKPFYISSYEDSELSMSFDLQFSNIELSSGGVRIHDVNKLKSNIERSGLDIKNFESHLQTFKWGMPPHSGLGLGFDRLIMVLANRKNIREAVLYPRDQDRLDP